MHEVRKHMEYEDKMVFSYVEGLLNGETPPVYKIATYSKHHEQVGETLSELKNILIKYCPEKVDIYRLNVALSDTYACEAGLEWPSTADASLYLPAI